jgi:hypothetical protein
MTIDELARAAGERLRERTWSDVDADASLDGLMRSLRRRRQIRIGAAAVSAAAMVVVVALVLRGEAGSSGSDGPVTPPTPTTTQSSVTGDPCELAYVTCDAGRPARIAMRIPVTWRLPHNFVVSESSFNIDHCCERPISVDATRSDVGESSASGVTVLEDVEAGDASQRAEPDTSVPLGPQSLANWLAARPDLESSPVSRGVVAGLPAWTVTVRVRDPHRDPAGICLQMRVNCTPVFYLGELADAPLAGMWGDMVSRFSFVELPEHDSAVVWSWAFGDESRLEGNKRLIDSIRFDVPRS